MKTLTDRGRQFAMALIFAVMASTVFAFVDFARAVRDLPSVSASVFQDRRGLLASHGFFTPQMAIGLLIAGIFAVVVLIGFTNLGPTVTAGVATYQADPYIDTASSNIAGLSTLLFTVGILVVAAFPAVLVMSRMSKGGGFE